jgi:hypothetical protein
VDGCDSYVSFNQDADLDGDFVMFGDSDGSQGPDGGGGFSFDVADIEVVTSGTLVIENPCPYSRHWVFASDASFQYDSFDCSIGPASCSTCGNPCDSCSGPYIIDTSDHLGACPAG